MSKKLLSLALAIALLWIFPAAAFAQDMIDVVYLKNGSIIRGTILELVPERSVKIETRDGSVFVYQMTEVDRIAKEKAVSTTVESSVPVSPFALQVNALGFLQFGPFVKAEIKMAPSVFLTPYIRFHAFGIASKAVSMGDADTISIDPTSLGIGIGMMRFFPTKGSPNGLYTGILGEYNWITAIKDEGETWEWRTESLGLVVISNVGYRWRMKPFVYSLGVLLGGYFGLSEEWWYLNSSYASTRRREGTATSTVYGMLEASIGFEFQAK
jgi:hypothetical protein